MAKRPKTVSEILDKKYMGKSFSSNIMNTPVDMERLRNNPLSQEQVEQVKKKYSIKSFSSREEFNFNYLDDARRTITQDIIIANKTAKERNEELPYKFRSDETRMNYIDKIANERLNKWWSYYQKRELLILSGQYDEIRSQQYREQYLKHLHMGNISNEIIKNIEDLSLEDWNKLVQQPDTNVDSPNIRKLPFLESVYSYVSHEKAPDIESEIKEAFKSAGIEFKPYVNEKARDLKRKKFDAITKAYYEGRYNLHKNDKGKWVAPLIGTEDGKDSDLVLELVEYIDKHSNEYD